MKKIITYSIKSFLLVVFCAISFLGSSAQRPSQNNNGDRAPKSKPFFNHPTPGSTAGTTRPDRQPPVRYNNTRPPSRSNNTVPARRFNNVDRGYRNEVTSRGHYNPNYYHYNNRAPVYSARNPSWRYGYLPRRNAIVTTFPFSYTTINFGGYGYRYYNGTYYRPYNNAYMVVAPPFGLYINTLPFGYRRIYVHDNPYYYYNGTYYDQYDNNYRVVAPPLGAVVESLPQGYETLTIDGETYYKVDGVQYKPAVQDNGEIWYEVIKVD